jgi:ankyrin repeat protein
MAATDGMLELTNEVRSMRQELADLKQQLQQTQHEGPANPLPAASASVPRRRAIRSRNSVVRDPFFAAALKRAHPMYVVRVRTLLAPSFQHLRPHEELKAAGMLVEWQEGMGDVLFCSHTWLRGNHPDSEAGEKFALLTALLRKIQAGKLDVLPDASASFVYKATTLRLKAQDLKRSLANGYVFFDYMSIPQQDPEAQQRAVTSLASYVSASAHFFVLAGPWRHENGSIRDDFAWGRRGWCRMELAANLLSPTPKPMVLAKSATSVIANPPGGKATHNLNHYLLVGKGDFSVETDRQKLGAHLLDIIIARKALALANGNLFYYRTLHTMAAHFLQGTGREPERESFDQWMATMKFNSIHDGSIKGLTPLFYAAIGNHADLVAILLTQGAEVNRPVKHNAPEFSLMKGTDVLMNSINFGAGRVTIALLMNAGANLRYAAPPFGMTAIALAISNGNIPAIELLLDADPTLIETNFLNDDGNQVWMTFCSAQNALSVFNLIRDRYPQQLPRMMTVCPTHGGMGHGAVAQLCIFHGDGEVYDAVMDTGLPFCDPNIWADVRGLMRPIVRACDLLVRMRHHDPGVIPDMSYMTRCSAIHVAAYSGNLGALEKLIERKVDINSTEHHWKMTPLHLAVMSGHETICARLISLGAAIEIKDKRGRSALNWAKRLGREDCMQLLLGAMRRKQVRETGPTARV